MYSRGSVCACLILALLAHSLAFPVRAAEQQPLEISPRNANYTISVRLDPVAKTLDAREILDWRNDQPVPAKELRFHLYWNAWLNDRSTWMREDRLRIRPRNTTVRLYPDSWSEEIVQSVRVIESGPFVGADLTLSMRYDSPDDGNPDDRTVLVVPLPRPVASGESIRVEVAWKSKIPRTFARTGFRGNYFFIVQWFPKLGVFQKDGTWNCHQFHAATEFFSDYGVYDVQMTVPTGWKLGATGVQTNLKDNPDGTSTHRYQQSDVHDFAWTTSPDYLEARHRFEHSQLKAVDMRLLYQPEHKGQVERHFRATEAALTYYGLWFGEYPYGHVTVIDPAYGSGAGGMEYPTLFTAGTRYWNPFGGGSPEGVTIHEAGHQFWYGLVGNNEFEHAWIDEGLNTYSTSRVFDTAYPPEAFVRRFFRGFFPVMVRDVTRRPNVLERLASYRRSARSDVPATPTYLYYPDTAADITYSKTALWLTTLENLIGWEKFQRGMSLFFQRGRFRHPEPADFFAAMNEGAGEDLTWYFDQVYRSSANFDFAVDMVSSKELKMEGRTIPAIRDDEARSAPSEAAEKMYETSVVVRRLGDGMLPVEVLLKFENGEEVREVWDGKAQWKLFSFTKPSRLAFAAVDPDHNILLDVNYANNSRRLNPTPGFPATKWASKWMVWFQDFLLSLVSYS